VINENFSYLPGCELPASAFSGSTFCPDPVALDWTSPRTVDMLQPHFEALSNTSGLTPPRWLCRRVRSAVLLNCQVLLPVLV